MLFSSDYIVRAMISTFDDWCKINFIHRFYQHFEKISSRSIRIMENICYEKIFISAKFSRSLNKRADVYVRIIVIASILSNSELAASSTVYGSVLNGRLYFLLLSAYVIIYSVCINIKNDFLSKLS